MLWARRSRLALLPLPVLDILPRRMNPKLERILRESKMKVVILAGGIGSRLQEETHLRPKPMVEVGGQPILWHIMKHYAHHQFTDFYVALGYLGDQIKQFFLNQYNLAGSLTVDFNVNRIERQPPDFEKWRVNLVDTGSQSMTGGRLLRLRDDLHKDTFMLTYGDGVSDVDITKLLNYHHSHGRIATVTAVRPPARFGGLKLSDNLVTTFSEKPSAGEGWINGGFLIFEPQIFNYLSGDDCVLETALERLATEEHLMAYKHSGFWQCMDTIREKNRLQELWDQGNPPWRTWEPESARNREIRLYDAA